MKIECSRPASWKRKVEWSRAGEAALGAVHVDDEGLAAGGYDVVAYHLEGEARRGSPKHEIERHGVRYRFASADHLRRFEQDPERFLPAYGGWCAYGFSLDPATSGGWKPGPYPVDPESFLVEDGRLLLFYRKPNFDARAAWLADPEGARQRADREWAARAAGS